MENSKTTKELYSELAFSDEELRELDKARSMPIVFDEDCPETTPEKAVKFKRVNPRRLAKAGIISDE
ncbi:MAG: hypothetical protein LUE92_03785 [Clostridiales bacterium]|nr:hypothetical protein [Clostridiales bacterium]